MAAPVLSSISPTSGSTSGGTTVTLTGTGLTGTTTVKFGTTPATSFTVVSSTQITATSPAHAAGTVSVTVTNSGGTSNGLAYQYVSAPVPALTGISPGQGPTGGGNTVTLTGSGLTGTTAVKFGTTPATSFAVVSDTQITATAPPGAAGTVSVTVTTTGGTSNGLGYTYLTAPALTGAAPNKGPVSGGNTVTLTGSGLTLTTAVTFGTTPASFTVVSDTQLTAIAPPGTAGTVQITVTTPGGTSNGVPYSYAGAPVLSTVAPGQGPASGGNPVTLTGSGLTGATAVLFGGVPAISFTVVSDTQITATAPAVAAGTVQITVTTPAGTSNPVAYFALVQPVLTSAAPGQGPTSGGNPVTLTGSGLATTTAVRFGTTPATSFTVVSDTQITATAPPAAAGPVQITVTTPAGTSNGVGYTCLPAPALTGAVPGQGPASGGTIVTLTGTALTYTTAVAFGTAPASFAVVSDTQLTAVAPPGAGPVQITVATPGGTSNGLPYGYAMPPAV